MKKIVIALAAGIVFCMAQAASAQTAMTGVYVAPKFVFGYTVQDSQKGSLSLSGATSGRVSNNFGSDNDDAWGGAFAAGYDFAPRFNLPARLELEYAAFSQVDATGSRRVAPGNFFDSERYHLKQRSQVQTLLVNAYYDIDTGTAFTPYVGAGIGIAFIDSRTKGRLGISNASPAIDESISTSSSSNFNSNLAWNVGAGVAWDLTDMIALDLGYRFVGLGRAKGSSTTSTLSDGTALTLRGRVNEMYMHQIMLGLRFTF